jgi:alkylation response protein AidB-like acyl-CoA dehydrogenase
MNLLPSEDQAAIVDAVKDFLNGEAPVDRLRAHGEIGNPDAALWPGLGALGFIGLGVDEAKGGAGLTAAEEVLAFREYGRHLLSPAIIALTLASRVIAGSGQGDIAALLAGTAKVGLANPRGPAELGTVSSGSFHLIEAADADYVLAFDEKVAALFRRADFASQPVRATDALLSIERGELKDARPVAMVTAAQDPIHERALLLIAAMAVGVAEGARDMAVSYAQVREQFGKPIGTFQAVKHRCAEMAIRTEAAWCLTAFASLAFADEREDARFMATSAKIVATDAALKNAAANIQVHGAIGFTAEADAHHYLKRAHLLDQLAGDLRTQRERLIDMPAPL